MSKRYNSTRLASKAMASEMLPRTRFSSSFFGRISSPNWTTNWRGSFSTFIQFSIIPEMIRAKSSTKLFERVRQLTACENRGKHHIFIRVQDAAGQDINSLKELTN